MNETPRGAPAAEHGTEWKLAVAVAERYRDDEALRSRLEGEDAPAVLSELGLETPEGLEIRVSKDTDEVFHFVMPPDPNEELADEALTPVTGGVDASTASSASTVGCLPSTVSTGGTASSIRPA